MKLKLNNMKQFFLNFFSMICQVDFVFLHKRSKYMLRLAEN